MIVHDMVWRYLVIASGHQRVYMYSLSQKLAPRLEVSKFATVL